jgi:hypothetical protein
MDEYITGGHHDDNRNDFTRVASPLDLLDEISGEDVHAGTTRQVPLN